MEWCSGLHIYDNITSGQRENGYGLGSGHLLTGHKHISCILMI